MLEHLAKMLATSPTSDLVRTVMWMQSSSVSLPVGIPEPVLFSAIRRLDGDAIVTGFRMVCRELDMRFPVVS